MPFVRRLWSRRRDVIGGALYWSGAGRAFELASRPQGAIILMYHSVAPRALAGFIDPLNRVAPALFERQMAFLRRQRRVVPLAELAAQVAARESPPAGTVCITFDDGYLDNLTIAAPILEKYGLPATLFLATGYVTRGEAQWADVLHWIFNARTRQTLALPALGLAGCNLDSTRGRDAARRALHRHLLEARYDERKRTLEEVRRQLQPAAAVFPRITIGWDEVRELRRRHPWFEIGGHTRDHIDLRTHRGEAASQEVRACAEDLRGELGAWPAHFSFPYSRDSEEARWLVRSLGWKSAVGAGDAMRITAASDAFSMRRAEAPRSMTQLRWRTSGAYPGAFAMLGLGTHGG